MAEARRLDEGERRDLLDVRSRNQATDHLERTKPDQLHSSQGPLCSLRAAIKRTRTNSQSDHNRERRRPEITIVSAEPLANNNWFPGTSVVFPRPPQPGWSAGVQAVSQPPPSYDQVIHEKTQEEHKPTAAPRQTTCTTTCATQTDPVREVIHTAVPQCTAAPQPAVKQSAGKKPQKPPRPSLPKPAVRKSAAETAAPATPADEKVGTNTEILKFQNSSNSDVKQPDEADCTYTCSRSVTVHWDIPTKHFFATAETTPSSSDSIHSQHPVPLPRTKSRKQAIAEEVKVQTLVKLSEHCDSIHSDPVEAYSNKYLKELLEVFSADNQCEDNRDNNEVLQGEDAGGEMKPSNSQRNIQARIQAFESQTSIEDGNAVQPAKPEPRPRKAIARPPVAAKPSAALKPQSNPSVENYYQNTLTMNSSQAPATAPRPQPPKKPVEPPVKEELETLFNKTAIPNRSRPSLLTRANSIHEEDPSPVPPTPPVKPFKEPLKPNLNVNNHNSTSMVMENVYEEVLHSDVPDHPDSNVGSNGSAFTRQSATRRPTTIRLPSKTGSVSDTFQDNPPPLPAQKPVGSLNTSVTQKQSLTHTNQESFHFGSEPSLPPRKQTSSKPARPPPAKAGPGRPPAPGLQATGRSHSTPWEASPKPSVQKPQRKGPDLPPRPNPGHRLYNKYTYPLPHGIASFDYSGSNAGELSFQFCAMGSGGIVYVCDPPKMAPTIPQCIAQNEVLLLLEEIDHNTFECQVRDTRGRVDKSHMKVINPLSSVSHTSQPQDAGPAGSGGVTELKVQATHDFNPEGPGELGLRAGDVVTMVEQVDSQWYRGTCRGSTGYFPANHVKVLSSSPKPLPEQKAKPPSATVSGPRCVARFDFEGESGDELPFSEGDVIQLKAYVGQDWARGQLGTSVGIFPLNFVEIIEDLPPAPSHAKKPSMGIALPGMVAPTPEAAKPAQVSQPGVEWVVALYNFAGASDGDLSFQQGDKIQITQHVDAEWSCGRLDGREGMFPRAFVERITGQHSPNNQQSGAAAGSRGRALFNFTSDCDEELSLQVGDIIIGLESVDEEWFLGDLRGKRALVPKNYVQVL